MTYQEQLASYIDEAKNDPYVAQQIEDFKKDWEYVNFTPLAGIYPYRCTNLRIIVQGDPVTKTVNVSYCGGPGTNNIPMEFACGCFRTPHYIALY